MRAHATGASRSRSGSASADRAGQRTRPRKGLSPRNLGVRICRRAGAAREGVVRGCSRFLVSVADEHEFGVVLGAAECEHPQAGQTVLLRTRPRLGK